MPAVLNGPQLAPTDIGLSAPPGRVVSLVPSVSASLFDLGLGGCLAGVTDFCVYPPEGVAALPKVGGTKNPNLDRVLELRPDLVIANQEENRPEDLAALEAAGIPVWLTFPQTVRAALDVLWATIRLFNVPDRSLTLVQLEKSVDWAARAAESAPAPRVFCPVWREPAAAEGPPAWWMAANRHTYLHDVLRVCGGDEVFADRERRYPLAADLDAGREAQPAEGRDTRYPRVTPAEVAAAAPDVILLPSEPYPFAEADLAAFDGFPEIPAVKRRRIYVMDGSLVTWPGTHLARALAELPALLASEAVS